jgi:hypothetical protein
VKIFFIKALKFNGDIIKCLLKLKIPYIHIADSRSLMACGMPVT